MLCPWVTWRCVACEDEMNYKGGTFPPLPQVHHMVFAAIKPYVNRILEMRHYEQITTVTAKAP